MEKSARQRGVFLLFCLIWAFVAPTIQPRAYGNDETSIKRYIYQEDGLTLGDHIELLAVEDVNEDRIAIFRRENQRRDEVYYALFEKNDEGNYEGWSPHWMHSRHPGPGIYTAPIPDYSSYSREDQTSKEYYVVWSENPELASITFQLDGGEIRSFAVNENPSTTIIEFQSRPDGWSITVTGYDAEGNELF